MTADSPSRALLQNASRARHRIAHFRWDIDATVIVASQASQPSRARSERERMHAAVWWWGDLLEEPVMSR
jgi:hypothetical protein